MHAPPNDLTTIVVLRPKRGLVVALAFLEVVFVLLVVGAAVNGGVQVALPVLLVVLFAWLLLVVLRRRTEVGPHGLTNRTWKGEEHIPWSELSRAMASPQGLVMVTRRSGGQVALPGPKRTGPSTAELMRLIEGEIDRHRPAAAPVPASRPGVIERRGDPAGARKVFAIGAVVAIGVGLGASSGSPVVGAVVGVLVLGLFGLLALAVVRARTVIGQDGIHNRVLRGERFIPWADIESITGMESPPRVIRVVGPGARTVTLAAITERAAPADGITFDDLVAVIRERAGLLDDRPPGIDTPAPAEPLSLRPSRLPILWLVPFALAILPLVFLSWGPIAMAMFFGYLLLIPIFVFMLVLKLLLGRTEADADGVRNRMITKRTVLRWSEVDQIIISPTPFGRRVQLKRGNKQVALAAPREGLLAKDPAFDDKVQRLRALAAAATGSTPPVSTPLSRRAMLIVVAIPITLFVLMAVWLSRPWLEPWWPGRHEAGSVPRDCALSRAPALVPGSRPVEADYDNFTYSALSTCTWEAEGGPELTVGYEMDRKSFDEGATEKTRNSFDRLKTADVAHWTALPNVGDDALTKTVSGPGGVTTTYKVRRANVVVTVEYQADQPSAKALTDLRELVRESVAAVHID